VAEFPIFGMHFKKCCFKIINNLCYKICAELNQVFTGVVVPGGVVVVVAIVVLDPLLVIFWVDEVSMLDKWVTVVLVLEVLPVAAKVEAVFVLLVVLTLLEVIVVLEVLILLEVPSVCSACVKPPLWVAENKLLDGDPSWEFKLVFAAVKISSEAVVESVPSLREVSELFSSADSVPRATVRSALFGSVSDSVVWSAIFLIVDSTLKSLSNSQDRGMECIVELGFRLSTVFTQDLLPQHCTSFTWILLTGVLLPANYFI
jgi:hypothetical protein